ncbi:MAG: energy-coupling factor transporter transmembrane protein EcfT [Candidatus Saccharibacteria bacterium]|nr:energy-coupling factor transporter transmembrane protein EcfT [Pseudorhodobacter sp.]
MLTLTSPVETWAHRVPAGVKLALLCLGTVLLYALTSPAALSVAALAVLALLASGGALFLTTALRLLRPLWPFILIVALWHLWLHDPQGGAAIVLRLVATVAAANFVTMTTRLSDMIAVITKAASPLRRIGLQPATLALAVALVIRFIPVMLIRTAHIAEAFRARSTAKPRTRLLVPALLAALDDADQVAEALRARGGLG